MEDDILSGKTFKVCLILFLLITFPKRADGQTSVNTALSGTVTDAVTREPMAGVAVSLENTTVGTITDAKGKYSIITSQTSYKLRFDFLGYEDEERVIVPGKRQTVNASMTPSSIMLNEVVVKPAKKSYRNKNNPSVDLIERVIRNKDLNRKENLGFYKFGKYDKIVFAVSNIGNNAKNIGLFKDFSFIFDNLDTTRQDGRKNLPLFLQETESDFYYRRNPRSTKEIINAEKTINFNEYIDPGGINAYLRYMYQNINIYDNEIFFLTNKFLSPIASSAPAFYRFFIQDTSDVEGTKCIRMFFEPRNKADFMFHGFLFITYDSSCAIKKLDISFNKGINIDWIKDVRINQTFSKVQDKAWILTQDDILIDFGLTPKLPGILGERSVSYNDYTINEPIPDSVFKGQLVEKREDMTKKSPGYWETVRNPPLKSFEKNIYSLVDTIKTIPSFRRKMDLIMLLTTSFYTRRKVEFGPVGSFLSYNPVEGYRLRFGGRTTPAFSNSIYFDSFIAYGFRDGLTKYNLTATYSIPHTTIYHFPVNSLKVSYKFDTSIPGMATEYYAPDNFFLSFRRGLNDKIYYNRTFLTEYLNELPDHFSYTIGYQLTKQSTGGNLHFIGSDTSSIREFTRINISEAYLNLRYAPNEEFYQGKLYRDPVPSKSPVLELNYTVGNKKIGNDYDYQKVRFSVSRRFYFSIVGYSDVQFEAGKIFGTVPYPYLFIHNANQTYIYDRFSYNMMNFLEFVSDKYAALNIDHSFNGFFFNKIPLLKKFRLREVATLKVLYGGVSNNNDPNLNNNLFRYPTDVNGVPLTYTLEKKPYIEASIGCSNIFRVLRVDIVKRFSYLSLPNSPSIGIRFKFKFDL
ncbi:MAG TPA: DUF5686 family protein [Bacteroidales bacterium]|nr:DUF5686 family protein [Bacteroidales bacterium]